MHLFDFPRSQRLLTSRDFTAVFSTPLFKVHTANFLLLALNNTQSYPRLGCVVSKKHAKQAPQRNRIKRIIREFFRCNKKELPPFDLVVISKAGTAKQNNKTLFEELSTILAKIILIEKSDAKTNHTNH